MRCIHERSRWCYAKKKVAGDRTSRGGFDIAPDIDPEHEEYRGSTRTRRGGFSDDEARVRERRGGFGDVGGTEETDPISEEKEVPPTRRETPSSDVVTELERPSGTLSTKNFSDMNDAEILTHMQSDASIMSYSGAVRSVKEGYRPKDLVALQKKRGLDLKGSSTIQLRSEAAAALYDMAAANFAGTGSRHNLEVTAGYMPGGRIFRNGLTVSFANFNEHALGRSPYKAENKRAKDRITEHAHEYGFVFMNNERDVNAYQSAGATMTMRYVGVDLATYLYDKDLSFTEYYMSKLDTEERTRLSVIHRRIENQGEFGQAIDDLNNVCDCTVGISSSGRNELYDRMKGQFDAGKKYSLVLRGPIIYNSYGVASPSRKGLEITAGSYKMQSDKLGYTRANTNDPIHENMQRMLHPEFRAGVHERLSVGVYKKSTTGIPEPVPFERTYSRDGVTKKVQSYKWIAESGSPTVQAFIEDLHAGKVRFWIKFAFLYMFLGYFLTK